MPAVKSPKSTKTTLEPPAKSLGDLIDLLHETREKRRLAAAEEARIAKQYTEIEAELETRLKEAGLDKASGSMATASLSTTLSANVEDWDAFYKFIKRTNYFHLLQRRVSSAACCELFEQKGSIPGVVPVSLSKLNLRSK